MQKQKSFPMPPWDMEIAVERLIFEEAAWNTHDPEQIIEGYSDNVEMRDGVDFIKGKEQLKQFLGRKFEKQLDYTLKLDLWGALKARMAVRFESEWHDASSQWYRSYGVEVFQFNENGFVESRFASQETIPIAGSDRKLS